MADGPYLYRYADLACEAEAVFEIPGHIIGGHLKAIAEGEVSDSIVENCMQRAIQDGCMPCAELAAKMLHASLTTRVRLGRLRWPR